VPVLTILRLSFSVIWIAVFTYTAWEARNFPALSGLFPTVISVAGILLALFTLVIDVHRWRRQGGAVGADAPATAATAQLEPGASVGYAFARAGRYGSWLLGYLFLIWLVGLIFEVLVEYLAIASVHLDLMLVAVLARELDVVDHVAVIARF
jgi:hypothetical protein